MTIAELKESIKNLPDTTIVVDGDQLEIIAVIASLDSAIVTLWSEPK